MRVTCHAPGLPQEEAENLLPVQPGGEGESAAIWVAGALAGTHTPGRGSLVLDGTAWGVFPTREPPHMGESLAAWLAADVSRWVREQVWRHQLAWLLDFQSRLLLTSASVWRL